MPHKRAKRSVRLAETAKKGSNLAPSSSSKYDDAPRSAMRILNSHAVQQAFRAKGRKTSEDTGERRPRPKSSKAAGPSTSSDAIKPSKPPKADKGKGKAVPSILPHESLGEYNRRVESLLRPAVSSAIKTANQKKGEMVRDAKREKEERKRKAQGKASSPLGETGDVGEGAAKRAKRARHDVEDAALEFKAVEAPRRLNDIAQAPPSLPQIRLASKNDPTKRGKGRESVWTAKGKARAGLSVGQERIMEEERERVIKQYREMKAGREEAREREREKEAGKGKKRPRAEAEA